MCTSWSKTNWLLRLVLLCCFFSISVHSLRTSGTWSTDKVYTFLAKFAFQKTEIDEIETTRGYIYGNVTSLDSAFNSSSNFPAATLAIVDGEYVTDLYGNASHPVQYFGDVSDDSHKSLWLAENARCKAMFSRINTVAWHRKCQPNAKMDFLRKVPCTDGALCTEEDDRSRVIPGYQFTFTVQDRRQPRYWYLSLIACYQNELTCAWETSALPRPPDLTDSDCSAGNCANTMPDVKGNTRCNPISFTPHKNLTVCLPTTMKYDIWMVNGLPKLSDYYRFEFQFSFEDHEIFEIYIVFGLLYLILVVIFHCKYKGEYEPLSVLLFIHIWSAFTAAALQAIHLAIFSFNGTGVSGLQSFGGLVARFSDAIFLILLITTAEVGLPVMPAELSHFDRKVRRYMKRQYHRVHSRVEDEDTVQEVNNTLTAAGNTWTSIIRAKHLDWLSANKQSSRDDEDSRTGELDEESSHVVFFGLIKCTHRRKQMFIYLASMVFVFLSMELGLYIWALCDQDPVLDISVWNTTPGRLLVAARLAVTFWFLCILRNSHQKLADKPPELTMFHGIIEPIHFAAAYLLWLLSNPVIVFVAETSISPLWRKKTVIGMGYFFDYMATVLFVHMINRSTAYASQ